MNKILVGVAVVCSSMTVAMAGIDGAGVVTQNAFSFGGGGEFTVTPNAGYIGEMGLPADLSSNSFESFCMEHNELFSPGGQYNMCINSAAVLGGSGGPSLALTPEVAYLYWHFRMGSLVTYDYANTGVGRAVTAGQLQAAIWFFQGNQAGGDPTSPFVAIALGGLSGPALGINDVRVLNMYDGNGGLAQDQLTIVPTPGAAALAGMGLLAASRRRRA